MIDETFEWDDEKAADNWLKHSTSFETARDAFKDPFAVVWIDAGQHANEDRFTMIGIVQERLVLVAYTLRGERIRIISARKPEANERRKYHNQNR